jgi:hypothetical protein
VRRKVPCAVASLTTCFKHCYAKDAKEPARLGAAARAGSVVVPRRLLTIPPTSCSRLPRSDTSDATGSAARTVMAIDVSALARGVGAWVALGCRPGCCKARVSA